MWYEYHQTPLNNEYDYNDKICGHILIEASSDIEANKIAESLGIVFDEDNGYETYECRWQRCYYEIEFPSRWDDMLFKDEEKYCDFIYKRRHRVGANHTFPHSRVFYKSGHIKEIGHDR